MKRFYAQNSEYPRVIDTRDGFAVFTADAWEFDTAVRVADAMNARWWRDVAFVAEWLKDLPRRHWITENDDIIHHWREEMT
jgi:hypothetical protein